jgi:pimeloyl-ACP methyl ester carboxylesterase
MPKAQINGYEMNYEVTGSGTSFLFIHGGFGGAASTVAPRPRQPWQNEVAKSHQLITYDRRSAGQSSYPEDGYNLQTFAKDGRELLRHLNINRAIVMGDSAGGPIALTFALTYPSAVIGLVLAETSSRLLADTHLDGPARRRLNVLRTQGAEAAFNLAQQEMRDPRTPGLLTRIKPNPAVNPEVMKAMQQDAAQKMAAVSREQMIRYFVGELGNYSAYLDVDLTPRLHELQMPTLVIHGADDLLVPTGAAYHMASQIAKAEMKIIPDAGHGLMGWAGAPEALMEWARKVAPVPSRA